jgi:hypothetical protein
MHLENVCCRKPVSSQVDSSKDDRKLCCCGEEINDHVSFEIVLDDGDGKCGLEMEMRGI